MKTIEDESVGNKCRNDWNFKIEEYLQIRERVYCKVPFSGESSNPGNYYATIADYTGDFDVYVVREDTFLEIVMSPDWIHKIVE